MFDLFFYALIFMLSPPYLFLSQKILGILSDQSEFSSFTFHLKHKIYFLRKITGLFTLVSDHISFTTRPFFNFWNCLWRPCISQYYFCIGPSIYLADYWVLAYGRPQCHWMFWKKYSKWILPPYNKKLQFLCRHYTIPGHKN